MKYGRWVSVSVPQKVEAFYKTMRRASWGAKDRDGTCSTWGKDFPNRNHGKIKDSSSKHLWIKQQQPWQELFGAINHCSWGDAMGVVLAPWINCASFDIRITVDGVRWKYIEWHWMYIIYMYIYTVPLYIYIYIYVFFHAEANRLVESKLDGSGLGQER